MSLWATALGLLGACVEVSVPLDAATQPDATTREDAGFLDARARDASPEVDAGGLPACAPALALTPAQRALVPLDVLTLVASGGTGAYNFDLVAAPSGAIVNELTGVYLAGATTGVVDRVRVRDSGCLGEFVAELRVVPPLELEPRQLELRPGTRVRFTVRGGSGRSRFSIAATTAGSTVTADGSYLAAASGGRDRVRVDDLETSQTAEARVVVTASAALSLGVERYALPVGSRQTLDVRGGSGAVELVGAPGFVTVEDGRLVGVSSGRGDVRLRDKFAGLELTTRVEVLTPRTVPGARAGNAFLFAQVEGPGDLDGDGLRDAVVAVTDHDLGANTGGAIVIYRGLGQTLSSTPARAIAGETRYEELGRAFAVGDLDEDGLAELIVGAPRADAAATDSGAVRIYAGERGRFFSDQPIRQLSGRFASDLFGTGVARCDFNGDGRMDLAVGARVAENRDLSPIASDQGSVFVYLQREGGFRDEPDQALYGVIPGAAPGEFVQQAGMQLGTTIAAGDLDGDGACDLVAASTEFDRDPANNTNDGIVLIYKGLRRGGAGDRGGVSAAPVRGFANTSDADSGGALGRYLLVVDLDEDGRAELIISHHNFDQGSGDNHGALRILRGAPLPDGPAATYLTPRDLDWSYEHDGDNDGFGIAFARAEVTGDGVLDLVVGALRDEVAGGPGNAGALHVFPGRRGQLPLSARPTISLGGLAANDGFAGALGALGDLDGDGRSELLSFAPTADVFGRDVGAPFLVGGALDAPRVLGLPGAPAGLEAGRGADVVGDLDGDGFPELVTGNPRDASSRGLSVGSAFVYRGTRTGFETAPSAVIRDFTGHGNGDVFGQGVSRAGDFDGDGFVDVAIVARQEDRPETFAASYAPDATCAGLAAASDVGAVFVFRGSASGLVTSEPAFAFFGVEVGDVMETVLGGFDYDGDGRDDLVVGSPTWDSPGVNNNAGGFALIRGRAATTGRTVASCAFDFVHHSNEANAGLGRALVALGDLDADGCDDLAIGAPTEDQGIVDQGSVRVVFGFGPAACGAAPRMSTLYGSLRSAGAGHALAAGPDLDGDGHVELAVGLPTYTTRGESLGAVLLLSSRALLALATEAPRDGVAPTVTANLGPFSGAAVLVGATPGGRFGHALSFVGDLLAVGSPLGGESGTPLSGGVRLFRATSGPALVPRPVLTFPGETYRVLGRLGETVVGRGADLVITGYDGQGGGLDLGSTYTLRP